jgi:hypothetical protein
MRNRRISLAGTAVLAALAAIGCPRSPPPPEPNPSLRDLSDSVREIEAVRAEKRELTQKIRDLTRAHEALQGELARVRAAEAEGRSRDEARIRSLMAQAAELEEQLVAAQRRTDAEAGDPGPEGLRRLFLTAVRRRDRAAIESLVDWEGFVEAALRGDAASGAGGEKAVAEFRALPEDARKERLGRAREQFLTFLLGEEGPRLESADPSGDSGFLRSRVLDRPDGTVWDVLLRKAGVGWKVVGMVRGQSPPETTGEETKEE